MTTATNKPFRFTTPDNPAGFKLVVFAKTTKAAREYVKTQGHSSLSHRALRYAGEGHPSNPEMWTAVAVRDATHYPACLSDYVEA